MDTSDDEDAVVRVAAAYGCVLDFEATGPIMERYGLIFA
jgi:hypothetical protein